KTTRVNLNLLGGWVVEILLMSHLTELAHERSLQVGFNLSTVGGEEQARLVALYVQALQTLPAAQHVQAQQSQAPPSSLIWGMSLVLVAALSLQLVAALSLPSRLHPAHACPGQLTTHHLQGHPNSFCWQGESWRVGLKGCLGCIVHCRIAKCALLIVQCRLTEEHAKRDIMEDYLRSMGAWRKECARVRFEDAAAERAAVLEHMKSAHEICQQDPLKVYDDEMDKMQKTWQKHKPKLELPD
ncbi:hypothetical protein QJQ45_014621, partial [Haematococcus lacustris]